MAIQQLPPPNTQSSSPWITTAGKLGRWMVSDWSGRFVAIGLVIVFCRYVLPKIVARPTPKPTLLPCFTLAGQQYGCIDETKYRFKNPVEAILQFNLDEIIDNYKFVTRENLHGTSISVRCLGDEQLFFRQNFRSTQGLHEVHLPKVPAQANIVIEIIGILSDHQKITLKRETLKTLQQKNAFRLKNSRWVQYPFNPPSSPAIVEIVEKFQRQPQINFERNKLARADSKSSSADVQLFNDSGTMRAGVLVLSNIGCSHEKKRNVSFPFAVPNNQNIALTLDSLKAHWVSSYVLATGESYYGDVDLRIIAVQDASYEDVFPLSWT